MGDNLSQVDVGVRNGLNGYFHETAEGTLAWFFPRPTNPLGSEDNPRRFRQVSGRNQVVDREKYRSFVRVLSELRFQPFASVS